MVKVSVLDNSVQIGASPALTEVVPFVMATEDEKVITIGEYSIYVSESVSYVDTGLPCLVQVIEDKPLIPKISI